MACMLTAVCREQARDGSMPRTISASLRLVGKVGASLLIQVGTSKVNTG